MLQSIYVFRQSDGDSVELIVLFSIVLTCLSLLLSISSTAVLMLKILVEYNHHVLQITTTEVKMTLRGPKLRRKHGYTHSTLQESMMHVLRTCSRSDLWTDRKDIALTNQVFYIENRVDFNQELDCYFEFILTCYSGDSVLQRTITTALQNVINEFENNQSDLSQSFIQVKFAFVKI